MQGNLRVSSHYDGTSRLQFKVVDHVSSDFDITCILDAVVLDIQEGRIVKHTCYQKHKSVSLG